MARIFITGSTDGLGRGAARVLMDEGHEVVLHARTRQRAAALSGLAAGAWNAAQAYAESKLQVTALALTLARAWPQVLSNAVDPGWVPTKMGGPAATGVLELGYLTQTWLAASNDTAATVSGGYWYHRQRREPAAQARDPAFQNQLMDRLAALTGVTLP